MPEPLRLLNKSLPGCIIPVTNVSNAAELKLLMSNGPMVSDSFSVFFRTQAFEIPAIEGTAEILLGYAPIYPSAGMPEVPYYMQYCHSLTLVERHAFDKPYIACYCGHTDFEPVEICHSYFTKEVGIVKSTTNQPQHADLSMVVRAEYGLLTQADEIHYGRNFVDWSAWPNNSRMVKYFLDVKSLSGASFKFPAMCATLHGDYTLTKGN